MRVPERRRRMQWRKSCDGHKAVQTSVQKKGELRGLENANPVSACISLRVGGKREKTGKMEGAVESLWRVGIVCGWRFRKNRVPRPAALARGCVFYVEHGGGSMSPQVDDRERRSSVPRGTLRVCGFSSAIQRVIAGSSARWTRDRVAAKKSRRADNRRWSRE
jgi:hypothetical protein